MNIFQAIGEIIAASKTKHDADHAEEKQFRYQRSSMLQERQMIQQLHRELLDQLKEMEESKPPIKSRLIRVSPECAKFLSLSAKGVRLQVAETPQLGVFRIDREEDVLA